MYTVHEGMVSRTFTLSGDVRVTTNPYDADILVYVTTGGADLVVSWVVTGSQTSPCFDLDSFEECTAQTFCGMFLNWNLSEVFS